MPKGLMPQVGELLFAGFGHSLMIERANRLVRDAELRDSANTSMQMWKAWSQPVQHAIMAKHDRREVSITAEMPVLAPPWR